MGRQKLVLFALVFAALSFGVAACGDDDDDDGGAGETSLELTIGDSVPLSGDLADFGPPGQKAADVADGVIQDAISEAGVDHTGTPVPQDKRGGGGQTGAAAGGREKV